MRVADSRAVRAGGQDQRQDRPANHALALSGFVRCGNFTILRTLLPSSRETTALPRCVLIGRKVTSGLGRVCTQPAGVEHSANSSRTCSGTCRNIELCALSQRKIDRSIWLPMQGEKSLLNVSGLSLGSRGPNVFGCRFRCSHKAHLKFRTETLAECGASHRTTDTRNRGLMSGPVRHGVGVAPLRISLRYDLRLGLFADRLVRLGIVFQSNPGMFRHRGLRDRLIPKDTVFALKHAHRKPLLGGVHPGVRVGHARL